LLGLYLYFTQKKPAELPLEEIPLSTAEMPYMYGGAPTEPTTPEEPTPTPTGGGAAMGGGLPITVPPIEPPITVPPITEPLVTTMIQTPLAELGIGGEIAGVARPSMEIAFKPEAFGAGLLGVTPFMGGTMPTSLGALYSQWTGTVLKGATMGPFGFPYVAGQLIGGILTGPIGSQIISPMLGALGSIIPGLGQIPQAHAEPTSPWPTGYRPPAAAPGEPGYRPSVPGAYKPEPERRAVGAGPIFPTAQVQTAAYRPPTAAPTVTYYPPAAPTYAPAAQPGWRPGL